MQSKDTLQCFQNHDWSEPPSLNKRLCPDDWAGMVSLQAGWHPARNIVP